MEDYQEFRLKGSDSGVDTKTIDVDILANGERVIFLQDIERIFPKAVDFMHGKRSVKLVKDASHEWLVPHCIKHCPGVVLDVVLSTAVEHVLVDSPVATPSPALMDGRTDAPADVPTNAPTLSSIEDKVVEALQVATLPADTPIGGTAGDVSTTPPLLPPGSSSNVKATSNTALTFSQVVKLALKKTQELDQGSSSELAAKIDRMIKLQDAMDAKQEEIKQLQQKAFGQQEEMKQLQQNALGKQEEIKQLQQKALGEQEEMKQLQRQVLAQQEEMKELQMLSLVHQEEMKQLQIQTLSKLAALQTRVQAILTQNFELQEYPIPRLFIVLPQDRSPWDIVDPFRNNFRLYFLCECGEHTKSINSKSTIPHQIHLAKHEGYDIARPTEFFQQYGPYVLAILKMLKLGIKVAGVAMPAISHLTHADTLGRATASLQRLKDNIEPGMDQVMDHIEKVSVNEGEAVEGFGGQMGDNEALEGADLRKLDMFLKDKDGNKVLGNLYRTVTVEGHVKWVCTDHYRENYQEKAVEAFKVLVDSLGGSFDENFGRVRVNLESRELAERFYVALEKAKHVHELKIQLSWKTTYSDFKRLRDMLNKTSIAILDFGCNAGVGPTSDFYNRRHRYDPIFEIMRHPSIQAFGAMNLPDEFFHRSSSEPKDADFSNLRRLEIGRVDSDADIASLKLLIDKAPNLSSLTIETPKSLLGGFGLWPKNTSFSDLGYLKIDPVIVEEDTLKFKYLVPLAPSIPSLTLVTPKNFFQGPSPWPRNADFSNMKELEIGLVDSDAEIVNLKLLVAQTPKLTSLSLNTPLGRLPAVYSKIVEHQTFAITFKDLSLRILPPDRESGPRKVALQDLTHLIKVYGAQFGTLDLTKIGPRNLAVRALAEATRSGSRLKELTLEGVGRALGDICIKDLASIVARSGLCKFRVALETEDARLRIVESIQWKHIRELEVILEHGDQAMKELLDDMKISERVNLEHVNYKVSYTSDTSYAIDTSDDTNIKNLRIAVKRIKKKFRALANLK
ncbi:hypothetical protein EDD21DRAFT_364254 [Dissophora ornata]|nr:hypothetical protein BGZ58_008539 [Dissophora ornata]KAI8605167.1 hypothetical protein EDD21DRAFT_364254 [Dissophora ornata]